MRHGKKFNHLGRTHSHRKAMLGNMASSLIKHKRITTTVAKAKALRKYVEPLVTKSKSDTTHSRRVVFSYLQDKDAVTELFREVSTKIADRPGGYTRIIKIGNRPGDQAEMAMIELVDYNELLLSEKAPKKKSTRRRGGKKSGAAASVAGAAAAVKGKAEEAVDAVEDVVEDVLDAVEDVVEEVKDKVEDVVEDVKGEEDDEKEEEGDDKDDDKK
ncbi:MAG: 50S ribosomal protein L17 [Bacteroidia bacterium]|nr:50S ribosomal protein L17 [Bacteroidia bacterium]